MMEQADAGNQLGLAKIGPSLCPSHADFDIPPLQVSAQLPVAHRAPIHSLFKFSLVSSRSLDSTVCDSRNGGGGGVAVSAWTAFESHDHP